MHVEVRDYTYEEMPDYTDEVPGAHELVQDPDAVGVRGIGDIVYGYPSGTPLRLRVVRPRVFSDPQRSFPCVLFVQGSHWGRQNLASNVANLGMLTRRGYVCAVVEYRDYGVANFPAPIADVKNAVRFVRSHAARLRVQPDRIAVMGDSSGGHVASLVSMTGRTGELDKPDPALADTSCEVTCTIDLYGSVDPTLPDGYPTTPNHQRAGSPECMLMGFDLTEEPERARAAVCKAYAGNDFGPFLIMHGTKDRTVACQQSVDLYQALRAAGKDAELYLVRGADHAADAFWSPAAIDVYDAFLRRCLG